MYLCVDIMIERGDNMERELLIKIVNDVIIVDYKKTKKIEKFT